MTGASYVKSRRTPYLVGKAFRSFLLASVLTAAASQVGALIDGLMLSRFINEQAMSAINVTGPVTQTLFAICILMGVGGTMLAGMAIGNHDRPEASSIFSIVMAVVGAVGILAGLSGMAFLPQLVALLCPDPALQGYTAAYLEVILPASAVYMLMVVGQMFVTLDGEPRRVTAAVATCMVVNLVLDYVFIAWCGWSMTGAAVATVISYLGSIAVLSPHFFRRDSLRFCLSRSFRRVARIAAMGLPFGIATVLIAVQMLGNNLVAINYLGGPGIVSLSVCMYLLQFSMIILSGTLESFQPVAAILKGSGDNRGVSLVLVKAYRFLAVSLALLGAVIVLFPEGIAALFDITDAASRDTLVGALPPFAANILLQCSVYLLIPVYQLYSNRKLALLISFGQPLLPMVCYWALAAASQTVAPWINPWWGFAIGQLLVVVMLLPSVLLRKGNHIPFVLIPRENPQTLFDASIRPAISDMKECLADADKWLRQNGIDDTLRLRVELACEESVKNIVEHALRNRSGHSEIDLRIALTPGKIIAVIRDEGIPFNPVEQDSSTGLGLMLVRKTCDAQKYEYIFHQNMLAIEWNR